MYASTQYINIDIEHKQNFIINVEIIIKRKYCSSRKPQYWKIYLLVKSF